jgi:hypothetical protein
MNTNGNELSSLKAKIGKENIVFLFLFIFFPFILKRIRREKEV